MANEEKKKRINMSIEATKPFNGNVVVRSARSAMVVSEESLREWLNDMTTLVNCYFEFREFGSGVALKNGQLQLTGSPDGLAEMMQMRADATTPDDPGIPTGGEGDPNAPPMPPPNKPTKKK